MFLKSKIKINLFYKTQLRNSTTSPKELGKTDAWTKHISEITL